jgi:ribonuclease HII
MGFSRVAGTDEAGRGALAGPLVAAAVTLPIGVSITGLDDSKRLTARKRKLLFRDIVDVAEDWSWACSSAGEIDAGGLQAANLEAMREAVSSLRPPPDLVMVDNYHIDGLGIPQWSLTRGDALSRCIAAASVLAKVIRDQLMWFWSLRFPQYGFEHHKGYGTNMHINAINEFGPSACHRRSYNVVKQMTLELTE